ncbi:hypothetical protein SCLCIDRAFT_28722 [Scleroderma citrinum Foug A]|uniref:DDE Tnp4 domain-containing protein n=1 Tax=Scleroderma citrinum Foug A TaxID=1036808 RepID=A0A0C2Z6M1_9AGAM|nr:hypothetical protein SCLCIDRAFT_28722 [Scleroderma citrinum Foug A]
MSLMLSLDSMSIDSDSNSTDTTSTAEAVVAPYTRLLSIIQALHDEVEMTRILEHRQEPMLKISQLPLLQYFAEDCVSLFWKKVRVNPPIFDDILDEISDHAVFQNQSNNKQFPISVQLAIFLNRVGHYGNASSPDDVVQWAGVSVGTVMNCTNRVMAALLARHDAFIYIPESRACRGWRNGVFAADGTMVNLYARPGIFGDGFYDRKSNFSLNCQAVVMPHNLMIVDYVLGQPGSVHDAYAFHGTWMYQDPGLIPQHHWIWADSAYPCEKWCAVPFKKPRGGRLTHRQNTYNRYLSKICVRVEHAFAALKGRFQSLHELQLKINKEEDLHVVVYWIMCCMILHNMIVHFEARRKRTLNNGSMDWAIQEAGRLDDDDDDTGGEQGGTEGQQFCGLLVERLLEQRGIHI